MLCVNLKRLFTANKLQILPIFQYRPKLVFNLPIYIILYRRKKTPYSVTLLTQKLTAIRNGDNSCNNSSDFNFLLLYHKSKHDQCYEAIKMEHYSNLQSPITLKTWHGVCGESVVATFRPIMFKEVCYFWGIAQQWNDAVLSSVNTHVHYSNLRCSDPSRSWKANNLTKTHCLHEENKDSGNNAYKICLGSFWVKGSRSKLPGEHLISWNCLNQGMHTETRIPTLCW